MNYYLVAIALSLLDLTYVGCHRVVDEFTKPTHAIVIDAGSSASRLNLFTFHCSVVDGQRVLDDSFFFETKPGLSDFAKKPKKVKKSLNILLDEAKAKIPREQWSSTPIFLRATAGLRLLPADEAQGILDQCKRVFASSGFKVSNDSVDIMSGTDEGIFSWVTVNFLLGKFDDPENTVAALDLGGASTQVTFYVAPNAIPKDSPRAKNIHHVSALGKNVSVFSETFLGMGRNAAREKILTHPDNPRTKGFEVTSECVSPSVSGMKWNYGGKTYVVSGPEGNTAGASFGFDKCIGIIKKIVDSAIPHDFPSLKEHEIYAFSYYFSTATEAGLIDETGGTVTVNSFYKKAFEVCGTPNIEDEPFMCLDLLYIYVLLLDGFGLDETTNISVYDQINGHHLTWALGAVFKLLQNNMCF